MNIRPVDIQKIHHFTSSAFSSQSWLSLYPSESILCYELYEGDQTLAVWALYKSHIGPLTYLSTPPYAPCMTLYFENRAQNEAKRNAHAKKVLRSFCDFLTNEFPRAIISLALPSTIQDTQVFYWNKYKSIPQYTYQLELARGITSIRSGYTPEKRNEIKKAQREGLIVKELVNKEELITLIQKTFVRKKEEVSEEMLNKILNNYSDKHNSFSLGVYDAHENLLAASHYIYDQENVYYLLSAYNPEKKHSGAGSLMLDDAICKSIEMGKQVFDFEGSMLPEVEKFVRDFGGKQQVYYRINKAPLWAEMFLKIAKREFF